MSPEERQLLTSLFERVRTASATPRDTEAENLIQTELRRQPYATYYLAQAVVVQEKGLEAAAGRIRDLEERIRQLEAGESEHRRDEQGGGFLSSIFGSSHEPQPAGRQASGPWGSQSRQAGVPANRGYDDGYRSAPSYEGNPSGGPWSGGGYRGPSAGSSFLTGALGTAAGVAGGMLLANSLSGIFSHHMAGAGLGNPLAGASAFGASEEAAPEGDTIINNYYGDDAIREASTSGDDADAGRDDGWQQADYNDADMDADDGDFQGGGDAGGGDDSMNI
jgi:hypothetical protein